MTSAPERARYRPDSLLTKEMEETNNWARLGFQMYFGWFALQFTVNAVAVGWFFSKGPVPMLSYTRMVFVLFAGWNLMGTITTFVIRNHIVICDLRIREVIEILTQRRLSDGDDLKARSPV